MNEFKQRFDLLKEHMKPVYQNYHESSTPTPQEKKEYEEIQENIQHLFNDLYDYELKLWSSMDEYKEDIQSKEKELKKLKKEQKELKQIFDSYQGGNYASPIRYEDFMKQFQRNMVVYSILGIASLTNIFLLYKLIRE